MIFMGTKEGLGPKGSTPKMPPLPTYSHRRWKFGFLVARPDRDTAFQPFWMLPSCKHAAGIPGKPPVPLLPWSEPDCGNGSEKHKVGTRLAKQGLCWMHKARWLSAQPVLAAPSPDVSRRPSLCWGDGTHAHRDVSKCPLWHMCHRFATTVLYHQIADQMSDFFKKEMCITIPIYCTLHEMFSIFVINSVYKLIYKKLGNANKNLIITPCILFCFFIMSIAITTL